MTSLLQSPIRDLLRELQSVLGSVGTSPKEGSPADQEIRAFLRPESIKTALSQANAALEASADHLEALDRLNQSLQDWHPGLVTLSAATGLNRPRCFTLLNMTAYTRTAQSVPMSYGPIY